MKRNLETIHKKKNFSLHFVNNFLIVIFKFNVLLIGPFLKLSIMTKYNDFSFVFEWLI